MITKEHRLAASAYQKCMNGDNISDEEIKEGIKVLNNIIPPLMAMGDHFYIATSELNRRLSQLESYRDARRMFK